MLRVMVSTEGSREVAICERCNNYKGASGEYGARTNK